MEKQTNPESFTKLEGTLTYVNLMNPVTCWEESKGKEWKISIVVDKKTAKAWNKVYKKQQAKEYDNETFFEKMKIDVPFPDEDEQYVITVRKNTLLANGNPVPDKYRPRLWEKVGKNAIDVTLTKEVSNGSKGQVTIDNWTDKKGNTFARLGNVLVTEMIEFVREGKNPLAAFGDDIEAITDVADLEKAKESNVASNKVSQGKTKNVTHQEFDDDIPF